QGLQKSVLRPRLPRCNRDGAQVLGQRSGAGRWARTRLHPLPQQESTFCLDRSRYIAYEKRGYSDSDLCARTSEVRPDLVINSAAVVGDWTVTASGPVNVAVACAERGVRQLLMSTDAVFASRDEGYREEDPPSPVTPYGAAKAAAAPIRAGGPR